MTPTSPQEEQEALEWAIAASMETGTPARAEAAAAAAAAAALPASPAAPGAPALPAAAAAAAAASPPPPPPFQALLFSARPFTPLPAAAPPSQGASAGGASGSPASPAALPPPQQGGRVYHLEAVNSGTVAWPAGVRLVQRSGPHFGGPREGVLVGGEEGLGAGRSAQLALALAGPEGGDAAAAGASAEWQLVCPDGVTLGAPFRVSFGGGAGEGYVLVAGGEDTA